MYVHWSRKLLPASFPSFISSTECPLTAYTPSAAWSSPASRKSLIFSLNIKRCSAGMRLKAVGTSPELLTILVRLSSFPPLIKSPLIVDFRNGRIGRAIVGIMWRR